MTDKIKFKFPENRSSGNNYFTTLEEKIELSEDDELLINREGITRKIKAKAFKGERGEKGEVGEKGERGLTGLQGEKGEKGDPGKNFEFSDFTSEQLEGLRGPEGRPGRDGTGAGDMLGVNNLSDLENKTEARKNLEVFSKYEVGRKIENEVPKILDNYPYQKVQDIRDNAWYPKSEIFKKRNIHFGFLNGHTVGLPGAWYDIITSNGWDSGDSNVHPVKQLALGPDGIFFRKQNGENSWGEWEKIILSKLDGDLNINNNLSIGGNDLLLNTINGNKKDPARQRGRALVAGNNELILNYGNDFGRTYIQSNILTLAGLPTSPAGLSSGMVYRDGDILKIVP